MTHRRQAGTLAFTRHRCVLKPREIGPDPLTMHIYNKIYFYLALGTLTAAVQITQFLHREENQVNATKCFIALRIWEIHQQEYHNTSTHLHTLPAS